MTEGVSKFIERLSEREKVISKMRDALEGWLAFAEEELSEFDLEECTSEKLCPKCESSGCINLKITSTREALAKAGAA